MTREYLKTASVTSADELLEKKDLESHFWKKVFLDAEKKEASDIHIETEKDFIRVRLRINGELVEAFRYSDDAQGLRSYINRLKLVCSFELSVNDESQERSLSLEFTQSRYRIALSPSIFGESFVFRVIRDDAIPKLSDLFLPLETEKDFRDAMEQNQGFICITGPTGSGKSTTLQSILMELDREKKKVITIENPVERIIPSTLQKEITSKVGWKKAIKMCLREDPDVILIGEVRDEESASLALEAAQTGHLVLTTLHTNDVAGTIDRLIGLGVDRNLLADNLLLVTAQRLAQKLCPKCKVRHDDGAFQRGEGCSVCEQKKTLGVVGRVPVVEYSLRPSRGSILRFSKENFYSQELKKSLSEEMKRLAAEGYICKEELLKWVR